MKAYQNIIDNTILVETNSAIYYIWTDDYVIDQFDKNLNYQGVFYCDLELYPKVTHPLSIKQIGEIYIMYQKIDSSKEIKLGQYLTHENPYTRRMIKTFLKQ